MGQNQGREIGSVAADVTTAAASPDITDHLETIESHMGVALGDPKRVEEAFGQIQAALPPSESPVPVLVRLASLLRDSRSRAAPALFRLLAEQAHALDSSAPVLVELLSARSQEIRDQALSLTLAAARDGHIESDLDLALAVACALPSAPDAQVPDDLGQLLSSVDDPRLPLVPGDPIGRFLEPSIPLPVRLLAARLLDADDEPAPEERIRRVLGSTAASALAHHLAYTRATHGDLVALTPGLARRVESLETMQASESVLGRDRLAAVVARLGWPRVADELVAEPVTVTRIEGSFPFALRPDEARVIDRDFETAGRWTGWAVMARGTEEATPVGTELDSDRIARFRRLSVDHAVLLGEILEVAPVTAERAGRILDLLERVIADHTSLFSGFDPEAAEVSAGFAELRREVDRAVERADDPGSVLPMDVAYSIQAFEDPGSIQEVRTLHGLKRYLHQRGLRHAFRLFGSGGAANQTVDLLLLRDGHDPAVVQRVRYLDFEEQEGSSLPLAVRLVVESFKHHLIHGYTSLPTVRILVYDTEVQFYVSFRNHPAFIRLDLSPPRRGGMIDLEYYAVSQYEMAEHPDLGVSGIQHILRRLGFHVDLDGTRLRARYDKERAIELSDIVEKASMLMRLVPHLMELDWRLAAADLPAHERAELADRWADFLERHGLIPPQDEPLPGTTGSGLIGRVRRELGRAGIRLPLPAPTVRTGGAGQLDLERAVLDPLRSAVVRGEVVARNGQLMPAPRHSYRREHEAVRLARILAGPPARLREAIRTASVIGPLERWLRFLPAGSIQGYPVERATLALRDGDATLFVLRDDRGKARLAFATRGDVPYRVRDRDSTAWKRPAEIRIAELMRLLVRDNYRCPDEDQPVELKPDRVAEVRDLFATKNPWPPSAPYPGERSVRALPAAPGRASGIVRIAQPGRDPAEFEGAVFIAPTIQPSDSPCLARSVAAVSTGGGTLSHVGLLALELGKPSVIVQGSWRQLRPNEHVLTLRRTELRERSGRVRSLEVRCWTRVRDCEVDVREGELVVVDSDAETLSVLGSDREALVLHQGFRDLGSAERAVGAARDDRALLEARGALLRVSHQLNRALRRMDRPALARYAVRELFSGQAAPGAAAATSERRALLDVLCRSPRLGPAAQTARDQAVVALLHQLRAAVQIARAVTPLLTQPLPVLFIRLTAVRLRESLRSVSVMEQGLPDGRVGAATASPDRSLPELDRLSIDRLAEFRSALLHELDALARQQPGDPRILFALRAIGWMDQAAPTEGDPRDQEVLERARAAALAIEGARRVAADSRLIVGWDESGLGMESIIGRKAASLGEVARVLPSGMVPPWFVITDRAFHLALGSHVRVQTGETIPLQDAIDQVLARSELDCSGKFGCIRKLWLDARFPESMEAEILDSYHGLTAEDSAPSSVAIRSSALEEDGPTATWAGQFDTFLHVTGDDSVLRHVRLAWAALWSPRALHQRGQSNTAGTPGGGGIMVQRMVDSRVAGVVLTVDAVAGEMRELVVNVGLGLGQGIVSGTVDADEIHIARTDRRGGPLQLRYRVGDKRERCVFDATRGSGTRRIETVFHQRLRPALEYTELETLVETALDLEAAFFEPLDLEFALEGSNLYILQARPLPLFRTALDETLQRYPLKESRG